MINFFFKESILEQNAEPIAIIVPATDFMPSCLVVSFDFLRNILHADCSIITISEDLLVYLIVDVSMAALLLFILSWDHILPPKQLIEVQ